MHLHSSCSFSGIFNLPIATCCKAVAAHNSNGVSQSVVTKRSSKVCSHKRRLVGISLGAAMLIGHFEQSAIAKERISQTGERFSPETDLPMPEFFKTSTGVKVQELVQGTGPGAQDGDRLEVEYVLRRNNGYFIYSTREGVSFQPKDIPTGPLEIRLGDETYIRGLQDALRGMKAGGKRRALVPPEQGYLSAAQQPQPPTFATQRQLQNHIREPLLFELQLIRLRQ